ncbi:MAG: hypothetical protein LBP67_06030 [Bacteroidales bacterium]|jgi:hypothetical protein|nr:hypothetical protein [Bacteroidales bacterium]
MNKRNLIIASIIILFATTLFSSCNKEKKYKELIVGTWLNLNENDYNSSSIITFNESKAVFQNAYYVSESAGYSWYASNAFDYSIEKDIITISGKTESGIDFYSEIRIDKLDKNEASLTTLAYTLNEVSMPDELHSFNVTNVEENSVALIGAWSLVECNCESDELDAVYYHFQENNKVVSYEKYNGEWTAYEHESYYCYGNFLGWLYKNSTNVNDPNIFEAYVFEKDNDKMTFTGLHGDISRTIIIEKIDLTELPTTSKSEIIER